MGPAAWRAVPRARAATREGRRRRGATGCLQGEVRAELRATDLVQRVSPVSKTGDSRFESWVPRYMPAGLTWQKPALAPFSTALSFSVAGPGTGQVGNRRARGLLTIARAAALSAGAMGQRVAERRSKHRPCVRPSRSSTAGCGGSKGHILPYCSRRRAALGTASLSAVGRVGHNCRYGVGPALLRARLIDSVACIGS